MVHSTVVVQNVSTLEISSTDVDLLVAVLQSRCVFPTSTGPCGGVLMLQHSNNVALRPHAATCVRTAVDTFEFRRRMSFYALQSRSLMKLTRAL